MFLLIQYLRILKQTIQSPAILLDVCLNLTQFIIYCLAAPENSELLLEYLNTHEALQRPHIKNDRCEISKRFEFCFCLHEKVISGRPENSCL